MSSCRFSGAQNTGNANNNYYNVKTDSLTYDGLFNENYFRIAAKEKEFVTNVEISHAITQHPITKQTEKFIGILTKSKYDGVGITEQIDVSIAIDASSYMTYTMNQERTKKKIDIAKETAKRIVGQLNSAVKSLIFLAVLKMLLQWIFLAFLIMATWDSGKLRLDVCMIIILHPAI